MRFSKNHVNSRPLLVAGMHPKSYWTQASSICRNSWSSWLAIPVSSRILIWPPKWLKSCRSALQLLNQLHNVCSLLSSIIPCREIACSRVWSNFIRVSWVHSSHGTVNWLGDHESDRFKRIVFVETKGMKMLVGLEVQYSRFQAIRFQTWNPLVRILNFTTNLEYDTTFKYCSKACGSRHCIAILWSNIASKCKGLLIGGISVRVRDRFSQLFC